MNVGSYIDVIYRTVMSDIQIEVDQWPKVHLMVAFQEDNGPLFLEDL